MLKLLGQHNAQGLGTQEIVAALGAQRSAVQRALACLIDEGLVRRSADGRRYHLGLETMHLGQAALAHSPLVDKYQFALQSIARQTGDIVFLTMRVGDLTICVHRDEGPNAVRALRTRPGDFRVLGTTAAGLAMLSTLDDEAIRSHHARHQAAFAQAGMDLAALGRGVANARRSRYAVLSDYIIDGITSIGICLHDGGMPYIAASITGAKPRMDEQRLATLHHLLRAMDTHVRPPH